MRQDHPDLSVRRQCSLLSLARSSLYYRPRGESAENLAFMAIIDRQFLETVAELRYRPSNDGDGTGRGKWPAICSGTGTNAGATVCGG